MTTTLVMRERCSMEAFQMWLDVKAPGHKVVAVKAEAPCLIQIEVVEDKDGKNL